METKTTFVAQGLNLSTKTYFAEELFVKKEALKKRVLDRNLQLKNLLKTNFELLKTNDINSILLF